MARSDAFWRATAIVAGGITLFGLYIVVRALNELLFQPSLESLRAPTPAEVRSGMVAAGQSLAGGTTITVIGGLLVFVGVLGVRRHAARERLRQQDEEPWR